MCITRRVKILWVKCSKWFSLSTTSLPCGTLDFGVGLYGGYGAAFYLRVGAGG